MASDAKKKKAGFTAEDWPTEGNVVGEGASAWCSVCRSCWCPHVRPALYGKKNLRRFYNGSFERTAAAGPPPPPPATAPSTDSPEFREWMKR